MKKTERIVNVEGKKYCMYFGMICEKYSTPGGGGGYIEVMNESLIKKIEKLL